MARKTQNNTNPQGWERIAKVDVQVWRDAYGMVEYAMVWIETAAGEIFERSILKGEVPAQVADHYRKRGWTDAKCLFHAAAS